MGKIVKQKGKRKHGKNIRSEKNIQGVWTGK